MTNAVSDSGAQSLTQDQRRLVDHVRKLDDCDCWIWQGQVSNSGYGRVHELQKDRSMKMVSAQAASYRAFVDEIPDQQLVKQTCGNRLCINPAHLELIQL
jgi:hypothetical protein